MPENTYLPCIILPGIGQSKVEQVNLKGEKIKMAWPLDIDFKDIMNKIKAPLTKMMFLRKDAGFSDKIASMAKDIIEPISSSPDGTMKNRLKVVSYPKSLAECNDGEKRFIYKMIPLQKLSQIIGENNLYFFAYNSFGDTYETAGELSNYIDMVKAKTGSEKVNLVSVSLGGALSIAYFELFRHKNEINRVLYFVAALGGSQLIADIMAKDIIPQNGLSVLELIAGSGMADNLGSLLKMLPDGVFEKTVDKALDVLIQDVLVNSLSMWGVIPIDRYKTLADKYISDKSHEALRVKADRFFETRKNFSKTAQELAENGVEFFAICGYGLQLLPIVKSNKLSSDGIIQISSTSMGALSAPLGEKLVSCSNEGKVCNDATHNHISPDNTIDASYGLWPEKTWYFASQGHDAMAYNDKALLIATKILSDNSFNSIYSDPDLPQFGKVQDNRK